MEMSKSGLLTASRTCRGHLILTRSHIKTNEIHRLISTVDDPATKKVCSLSLRYFHTRLTTISSPLTSRCKPFSALSRRTSSTARPVRPLCLIFFASILIILAAIGIISSPPKIKLSPMLISQSQWTLPTSTDSPSSKSRYFHGCVYFAHTQLYLYIRYI